MQKQMTRMIVIVVVQLMLVATMATGVFASDEVSGAVTTSITGHVWLDVDGSGHLDQAEMAMSNMPVFIQRLDQSTPDAEMTMIVYTDEIGGYSLEGLDAGTYQIWTETNSDSIYYLVITVDAASPTAIVDLPVVAYTVFMPTIIQ